MRASLQAVLDEAVAPEHCCASDIACQLTAVVQAALAVQKQIAKERELMVMASIEDPTYDGNVERLEQTNKSMERRAAAIVAEARGLRDDMLQKARYANEIKADVARHIASVGAIVEPADNFGGPLP
jgi:hypothetical protein